MLKTIVKFLMLLACIPGLIGCRPEAEVGYQPIGIPVRISVNTSGEIRAGFSGVFVTPIGVFDISGDVSVNSLRNEYASKVLIVRIDERAVVYELEEGKEFRVDFDDSNTLYKKVALEYESNGDIVLELESVKAESIPEEVWSGILSVRKPTLNEIRAETPVSLWDSNLLDVRDMTAPGIDSYSGEANSRDEYLFPVYWCATTSDQLAKNNEDIRTIFEINGEKVPDKLVFSYDYDTSNGWNCSYHAIVLGRWTKGMEYKLQAIRMILANVSDGQSNYAAGDYIFELMISAY